MGGPSVDVVPKPYHALDQPKKMSPVQKRRRIIYWYGKEVEKLRASAREGDTHAALYRLGQLEAYASAIGLLDVDARVSGWVMCIGMASDAVNDILAGQELMVACKKYFRGLV